MLEKLNDEVELYKLHVKHYHMSPAQFRRRTSMLGLPGEIYDDKYDKIFRTCRVCSTSKLGRDVNFLTGRWVLTVKVDKNGYFSKIKARWVCRGFHDKFAWDQQTDSPTATRYGFRLVAQCAANHYWDHFHLDLKTAFLQGKHYNLSSRSVVVQLPSDIGLPLWMVGLCLRPVYGLNDAPRTWWNRFLRSVGLEPTRADRCTYVAYDGIEGKKDKSYLSSKLLL